MGSRLQKLDVLSLVSDWAVSNRAFRRNKLEVEKKVVAAALCNAGYSYRSVAEMLGGISYIGARDAFISLNSSMPQESQRFRREIAIDGCDVVLGGRRFYLWLARDIDSGEVVSFYGSPSGSAEDGARFLASIGRQCSNRPRVRLGTGSNFPRGLLNLDLYFEENATPSFMGRIGRLFLGSTSRVQ